ncbi:Exodeoxyribonuclease III [Bienertia sinuspersici]
MMMSPLSLEEINLMDMSYHWKVSPQRPFSALNMKIALWNIRGACSDKFMRHAWDIIQKHKPSIIIFLETKCDERRGLQVKQRLSFTDYKVMNPRGKRRGIWLLWKPPVDLILFTDNDANYFHGLFRFSPTSPEVLLTGIHAPSTSTPKSRLWRDMQDSLPPPTTPWMIVGDLNEVTSQSEKHDGRKFRQGQCHDFTNFQDNAGMIDLGFQGNPFTWTNGREGAAVIRERLDRAITNTKWLEAFPKTKVMHLTRTYSDHCPILVNLVCDSPSHGNYPFRCKEV